MHMKFKLSLIIVVMSVMFCTSAQVQSQDSAPAAAPVVAVEEQPVSTGHELIVLELFSSQACIFCPKADQLFSDLIKQDHIIGVACHVDYFDVRAGSLSRPFCTARQNWYMQALGAGPNYTPQMIVNGMTDVVGYKADDVRAAIARTQDIHTPLKIEIAKVAGVDDFALSWASGTTTKDSEPAVLWLMFIDKVHDLDIAEGRNKGQKISYVNIVSDMEDRGAWNRAGQNKTVTVALKEQHIGFVIIAQEQKSGKILAAGQYRSQP